MYQCIYVCVICYFFYHYLIPIDPSKHLKRGSAHFWFLFENRLGAFLVPTNLSCLTGQILVILPMVNWQMSKFSLVTIYQIRYLMNVDSLTLNESIKIISMYPLATICKTQLQLFRISWSFLHFVCTITFSANTIKVVFKCWQLIYFSS